MCVFHLQNQDKHQQQSDEGGASIPKMPKKSASQTMVVKIFKALTHCHSLRILHGDSKFSTVMINRKHRKVWELVYHVSLHVCKVQFYRWFGLGSF
ncbi:hypothetical protein MATL_G00104340 [Megalops atlanticus]|uniref:Protein kinase domain-containing protein n=1 Tax=Megalops atlanticus TaxID=7932 RepID=A0A9D3PYP9_MEGAT|nr:hypothetical protein MATL_G00104340 [Megalops atlanticus]